MTRESVRFNPRTTNQSTAKRISVPLGLAAVTAIVTIGVVSIGETLFAFQIVVSAILIGVAVVFDRRTDEFLPFILRPSSAAVASVVVGAVAAPQLRGVDYSTYMALWLVLSAGMLTALVLTQARSKTDLMSSSKVDVAKLRRVALVIAAISAFSALFFFAWQGVPALSGNVEQGRVDAAAGGTGYVRLLAYMGGPAALLLVSVRSKWGYPALLFSAVVILALANRSPLLYLFVPLLFILAAQGRIRLSSIRILGAVALLAALILGIGTFRVFSQDEFANYDEYRADYASENYFGVASTTLTQYAAVVAENAVLTKDLVDDGSIGLKFGSSYFTLFISALPGEQLSLDREIKLASGKTFIGGGTPPTLMGEGYVNFGLLGTFGAGVFVVFLLRFWASRYRSSLQTHHAPTIVVTAAVYGYMLCWVVGSPVAGLAGASTVPLAGAVLIVITRAISTTKGLK